MRTAVAIGVVLVAVVSPQGGVSDPLKGIAKVVVIVDIDGKAPPGLAIERLQTLGELRLRTAGLQVASWLDRSDPDFPSPSVEVSITAVPTEARAGSDVGFAVALRLALYEHKGVVSVRNGAPAKLELWSKASLHIYGGGNPARDIEADVGDLLNAFGNDWLKANPRR